MLEYISIDIETVANERVEEYIATQHYKAAANIKDPVKIEANIAEKKLQDREKAALYWVTGRIILIGCEDLTTGKKFMFNGIILKEDEMLVKFFTFIVNSYYSPVLVGKNSRDFDLPFIIGRALVYKLGIPECLHFEKQINDVNHIFSRSSSCNQLGTLDDYAFALGMPLKKFSGSEVQRLYNEGRHDELVEYNIGDVSVVSEMMRRYLKPFVKDEELPV
jgi:predicted PolB exonuclease-like 3'-5' exonuclease